MKRRAFLGRAAAFAASTGLPLWFAEETLDAAVPAPTLGPNDKPSIGLIGCGGMGRADAKLAATFANIVAVSDVDSKRAEEASKQFNGAKVYRDFRRLLEREDIHAVINATPDHWHTFVNLGALKAGKDVYSEKPLTLTIEEGQRVVDAVRQSGRILQTGSQQRSDPRFRLACELVRNGFDGSVASNADAALPPHGVTFEGKEGKIFVTRGKIEASRPELLSDPLTRKTVELYQSDNHMKNFFDCLRSRRQPICPAAVGYRSVSVCHLGVIALRLGRKLQWNPEREEFVGDKEANTWRAREQRRPFNYEFV